MKNITLSADEKLIANARGYAHAHGVTLNDLIRDYLRALTNPRDPNALADEFVRLASEQPGCSEDGWRFNREEIHRRGSRM
jgi:uncharacterized protein (DUF2461 family)